MGSCKPDLLDVLPLCLPPNVLWVIASSLVDRERMPEGHRIGIGSRMGQRLPAEAPADRSHSVPEANEVRNAGPRIGRLEAARKIFPVDLFQFLVLVRKRSLVLQERIGNHVFVPRVEKATGMKHPGQRANRERAPAETEEEQPVLLPVVVHQKPIGIRNIVRKAITEW